MSIFDSIRATRDSRNDTSLGTKLAHGEFGRPRTNDNPSKSPPKSKFRTPITINEWSGTPSKVNKPRLL